MKEDKAKYETLPVLKEFLEKIRPIWRKYKLQTPGYYIAGTYWSTLGFVKEVLLSADGGSIDVHRYLRVGFDLTPAIQMTEESYEALQMELADLMVVYLKKGISLNYKIINPFRSTE